MWQLVVWIGLQLLSSLLFRPKTPDTAPAPGQVTGPVVDASSEVPVLFGERLLKEPNCVWYGDVGVTPIVRCGGGKK